MFSIKDTKKYSNEGIKETYSKSKNKTYSQLGVRVLSNINCI